MKIPGYVPHGIGGVAQNGTIGTFVPIVPDLFERTQNQVSHCTFRKIGTSKKRAHAKSCAMGDLTPGPPLLGLGFSLLTQIFIPDDHKP